jgi:hypothetical protein
MKLSLDRATMVAFVERMQRLYPTLVNFHQDQRHGESTLEENRTGRSYRWLSLETSRLASGYLSPPEPADAYKFNLAVLETIPHYLAVTTVDLDYIDVLWGFDFECKTNHHELIAEALLGESPFGKLLEGSGVKAANYEVSTTVTLSEDARTQARVWVEPRTSASQIRSGDFAEESLSVYVILRQFAGGKKLPELHEIQAQQIEIGEKFIDEHVIGKFLSPIRAAIARRS